MGCVTQKAELIEAYTQLKSARAVARKFGLHHKVVTTLLRDAGCTVLNASQVAYERRHRIELTPQALAVLDGLLLGDGHINRAGMFDMQVKSLSFVTEACEALTTAGIPSRVIPYGEYYACRSVATPDLLPVRARWYPKGIKHIPVDFNSTPTSWRMAFMGDGSLMPCGAFTNVACLHTQCFPKREVQMLVKFLRAQNIESNVQPVTIRRTSVHYILYICAASTAAFITWMGPPPSGDMAYKWNLRSAPVRTCKCCGDEFTPRTSHMVFCQESCGVKFNHPFYKRRAAATTWNSRGGARLKWEVA